MESVRLKHKLASIPWRLVHTYKFSGAATMCRFTPSNNSAKTVIRLRYPSGLFRFCFKYVEVDLPSPGNQLPCAEHRQSIASNI